MGKRGELTSQQIVAIVLAIVAFIILLAFLSQLGTEDYSSDEICRLSVLSRATAAEILPGTQQAVPLKCTTKKICLTSTKDGECPQFIGEKNVVKVQLPAANDEQSREQQAIEIERVMAQSMYDCWNIMGQGKLDIFKNTKDEFLPSFTGVKSTCVICSRVALADDIHASTLELVDTSEYMEKNTLPGDTRNYIEAITNGATSTYPSAEKFTSETKTELENNAQEAGITLSGSSRNEIAFVFMQIKPTSFEDLLKRQSQIVGAAASTVFVMKPSSIISAGRFILTPAGFGAVAISSGAFIGLDKYSSWRDGKVAAGYCGDFVTKSEDAKKGCSLLQGIPYSVSDINQLCGQIEGNI